MSDNNGSAGGTLLNAVSESGEQTKPAQHVALVIVVSPAVQHPTGANPVTMNACEIQSKPSHNIPHSNSMLQNPSPDKNLTYHIQPVMK